MNYYCLLRAILLSLARQALQMSHQRRMQPPSPERMRRPGDAGMESPGGLLPAVPWDAAVAAVAVLQAWTWQL